MTAPAGVLPAAAVRVARLPGRGRGLVAAEPIRTGRLIEAAPVVRLVPADRLPAGHPLWAYTFAWDEPPFAEAIAFGLMSLANHAAVPNAGLSLDIPGLTIRLLATADIAAGEEITIDYGIPLWFEAA